MAELPTVFSAERLPISESNIPSQKEIDKWSHLGDVKLQSINAQVGRLIGNDAPRALAVKAILGQKFNPELDKQSKNICDMELSDPQLKVNWK